MRLKLAQIVFALVLTLAGVQAAAAQSVGIIRDAEIERMIRDFAAPLLRAAGINREPRIYLVADRRFNAFVTEEGALYINYGTIIETQTPSALKAVLAHEIGHLAGGHLARIREQMDINARVQAVTTLLGIGAMAAASGSGNQQVGQMASAFIIASQSMGLNSLMAFRREEESAADAAAIRYLDAAGESTRGLIDVLTILNDNSVAASGASPYLRSHPLASDRLDQARNAAQQSRHYNDTDSNADILALAMAKAKLVGYLEGMQTTLNRFPNGDGSLPARYARVIAAYKAGGAPSALQQMPVLIEMAPSNPYLHELFGQMYYETGQAAAALPHLRRAVELAPDEPQIRALYGQALTDAGGEANLNEAIAQLNRVALEDPQPVRAFVVMSRAYAALGRAGDASLAAAEAALARGDIGTALGLARQAQQQLTQGSPAWLRANDILALG